MRSVTINDIEGRMVFDNPWWEKKPEEGFRYQDLPERNYLDPFYSVARATDPRRAVILMGPRRVGKTVMIHQSIYRLLSEGIDGNQILYISVDTPLFTGLALEQLQNIFLKRFALKQTATKYIFFDEIQYHKNWELHLKSLVDSYPAIQYVASGSAAAALRMASTESGAGRFTDFLLPPLTFAEYLKFVKRENALIESAQNEPGQYRCRDIEALNEEFVNYINFGGYPETVFSEKIQTDLATYIKSDIIDKVLLRDLPSLYGIQDIQELNRLFTTLAFNTGEEVSLEGLSQASGVAKNTIKRYLEYLEAVFLIRRVNRVDQNARRFKRATRFKVYLTNASMRTALFGPVTSDSPEMGHLTETAIFDQMLHVHIYVSNIYYARWKDGEVDFIGYPESDDKWAVEIKWSDRAVTRSSEIKGLIRFARTQNLSNPPLITTKTIQGESMISGVSVDLIQSSLYCYILGKNVFKWKTKDPINFHRRKINHV